MNNEPGTETIDPVVIEVPTFDRQDGENSGNFSPPTLQDANLAAAPTSPPVFLSNVVASTSQQQKTSTAPPVGHYQEFVPRFYAPYNGNNNSRPKRTPQTLHRPAFVPPQPILSPYYYSLSYVLPQYIVPTVRPPPILYCPPPPLPPPPTHLRNAKYVPANQNYSNNRYNGGGGARSYAKTINGSNEKSSTGFAQRSPVQQRQVDLVSYSEKIDEKSINDNNAENEGDYSKACDKAVETDRHDDESANRICCNGGGAAIADRQQYDDDDSTVVAQRENLEYANLVAVRDDEESNYLLCDKDAAVGEMPKIEELNVAVQNSETPPSVQSKSWASLFKSSPHHSSSVVHHAPVSRSTTDKTDNDNNRSAKPPMRKPVIVAIATEEESKKVNASQQTVGHHSPRKVTSDEENTEITICTVDRDSLATLLGDSLKSYGLMHRGPAFQLRVLVNNHNWCYANSVLQALMACPPFVHLFRHLKFQGAWSQRSPSSTPLLDAFVYFVGDFGEKIGRKNVHFDKGVPFEPVYIYDVLKAMKRDNSLKGLLVGEDAEQFLNFILNRLHDEMFRCMKLAEKTSIADSEAQIQLAQNDDINSADNCDDNDTDEWQQVGPHRKTVINKTSKVSPTPVSEIFCGILRNTVLQQASSKEVVNMDSFFTLELNVQGADITSVSSALFQFSNSYKCASLMKLKNGVQPVKRCWTTFQELPCVLILNLKHSPSAATAEENLKKPIHYGIDLQIDWNLISPTSPFRSKSDKFCRWYKLFAVVFRHGDKSESDRYTTDIFHAGYWLHVTDHEITTVDEGHVMGHDEPGRAPCLLFYRRCDLFSEPR